jgi:hypothetical protein
MISNVELFYAAEFGPTVTSGYGSTNWTCKLVFHLIENADYKVNLWDAYGRLMG